MSLIRFTGGVKYCQLLTFWCRYMPEHLRSKVGSVEDLCIRYCSFHIAVPLSPRPLAENLFLWLINKT